MSVRSRAVCLALSDLAQHRVLRSIHRTAVFSRQSNVPLCALTHLRASLKGALRCFCILAVVNNAAVDLAYI